MEVAGRDVGGERARVLGRVRAGTGEGLEVGPGGRVLDHPAQPVGDIEGERGRDGRGRAARGGRRIGGRLLDDVAPGVVDGRRRDVGVGVLRAGARARGRVGRGGLPGVGAVVDLGGDRAIRVVDRARHGRAGAVGRRGDHCRPAACLVVLEHGPHVDGREVELNTPSTQFSTVALTRFSASNSVTVSRPLGAVTVVTLPSSS